MVFRGESTRFDTIGSPRRLSARGHKVGGPRMSCCGRRRTSRGEATTASSQLIGFRVGLRVRDRRDSCRAARGLLALPLALALTRAASVFAAGVVGTGTPESCTEAALEIALACGSPIGSPPLFSICAGGSNVTFNCGPSPVTITVTSTKVFTSTDTTIDGGGLVTISGGNSMGIFSVTAGVTFTVQNLTITDGSSALRAGAIINSGNLTVTNSTFSGNSAGAISNNGILNVINSTFSGNSADCCGGGISNGGSLTVTHSTFSGNRASGGGALWNSGTLNVTNSTFSGNSAPGLNGTGGAISNNDIFLNVTATVNVTGSTFSGNSASAGGAIINSGRLTITSSTFSGSSAFAGGALWNSGTLDVTSSTFSRNSAPGSSGDGGGISSSGNLTVTNSTFSGNSGAYGGGISNGGTLSVTNCTFSGNSAPPVFGPGGGGIHNRGDFAPATLTNTILVNNVGGNCDGTITDGGHNLDDGTSCGFTKANGSLGNTDPQLDPTELRNNGGPTQTIALEAGSPAINAGDETICAAPPVNNRDQRGFVRPGTGATRCSIGAVEYNSPGPPACAVGDCNRDSAVSIDEIITLVDIALDTPFAARCPYGVPGGTEVKVALIIQAVDDALNGCAR